MPTKKPSRQILFEREELRRLLRLWKRLRKPGRRGLPEYIGQKLTLGQFIARLALERAAQVKLELAAAAPAPTSGTVERPMTAKKPPKKTKQTTKPPKPAEPAPAAPRRGRPSGRKKVTGSFSLDPDVAAYAKALGSPKVNDLLRRSMRAAQRKSR